MKKIVLAMLLAAGAFVAPAQANYFSNPYTGVSLNIGSAPNPTPADIRVDRLPTIAEEGLLDSFLKRMAGLLAPQTAAQANQAAQTQTQAPSGGALVPAASQSR
jgi:hypothetical protein